MQIGNSRYKINPKYYLKPTPFWIKIVTDCLLGAAGIVEVSSIEFPGKDYAVFGAILIKFLGKTIVDDLELARAEALKDLDNKV